MVLLVLLLIFFNEVMFAGKTFLPPDAITSRSIQPFVQDALDRGIYPLWNPYIFCGMPSFASLQSAPFVDLLGDLFRGVVWIVERVFPVPDFSRILFNYFLLGLFTYLLIMRKTRVRVIALFAALAFVFQPQVISFTAFGHNTKIATAVFIPLNLLLLDELLQRRRMRYFALLALAIGLQLLQAHTQIAYYTFMMMGLFVLYWIIESAVKKQPVIEISKTLGVVIGAIVIGVAMSAWLYLPVQEYAHYSIRGGEKGLDYGYATNWSFHPIEMVTFVVPSFMGFGGQTYWGQMPFTDYPFYMGIIPLMLAGLAILLKRRDKLVIFFSILALASLLVAFGKHFPILYGPLYELLPFFNKFRVPSMILILFGFAVVALAGIGLHALMNATKESERQKIRKYTYIFMGVCAVVGLFLVLGRGAYLDLVGSSAKPLGPDAQEAAYEMAAADGLKLLVIAGITGFLIIYYLQDKIKINAFGIILTALLVADLWLVDFKITDPKPKTESKEYFAENAAVRFLKRQDEPFRIYPVYDNKPETWYMYHLLQNIKGYHAAKLKIYQTFLEKTKLDPQYRNLYGMPPFLSKYINVTHRDGQPAVNAIAPDDISEATLQSDYAIVDMLNVKYLVSHYPIPDPRFKPVVQGRPSVFENTGVLPRAFFVDQIEVVKDGEKFFDYLNSGKFDPRELAILEEEPGFAIEPSTGNQVQVTSYDIHEITLTAEVVKPALMVLSEIYYPAGWKAYVDGRETKIYKTDYILRSIFLQSGNHDIKFVFEPKTFTIGVWSTFGILALLLGLVVYSWQFKGGQ